MYARTRAHVRGAYIATVELTHAFHARTTIFSGSTSGGYIGLEQRRGAGERDQSWWRREEAMGEAGERSARARARGWRESGRGVMSIIGFNIGALGKPVYKYPYATVITT